MYNLRAILPFCIIASVAANPKKYNSEDSGFQPSARRYHDPLYDTRNDSTTSDTYNRLQRFGIPQPAYGPPGPSGVGVIPSSTGIGYYPTKIDIGGIALGALLGLGIILIAPKIAHFLTGGYGGAAYRSLDEEESSITSILAKLDNSLEEHNIDSSSCMQRVICSYVNEAQKNMKSGGGGVVDELIYALANNPLVTFMLNGSSVKQAIDMGKLNDSEKCASLYIKCPISKENITQIITNLLPPF